MKRVIHAMLVLTAAIPWLIGLLAFGVALLFVLLADWVWPNATWGNCWSFVGPRWFKRGGYLVIRPADGVHVFGIGWVPHALWVKSLGHDAKLEQTAPMRRSNAQWMPWRTLYFPFKVLRRELPHPAKDED